MKTTRWHDQLMLVLGLWLFVSPWVLSYEFGAAHAINAFVLGAIIAIASALALYKPAAWVHVVNTIAGIWLAVSPWVLRAADVPTVMVNALIVGVPVALLALWAALRDPAFAGKHWPGQGATT